MNVSLAGKQRWLFLFAEASDEHQLCRWLTPFLEGSYQRIVRRVPGLDPDRLRRMVGRQLLERLCELVVPVCLVELHAARDRGELRGSTGVGRFQDFVRRLSEPETAATLLRDRPHLRETLEAMAAEYSSFVIELFERLEADRRDIGRALGVSAPAAGLVAVDLRGDLHRGGKCVAVLSWSGGKGGRERRSLVYKPRDARLDEALDWLLDWLQPRLEYRHRRPATLDRGTHAWHEYCAQRPCTSVEQVRGFYWRMGSLCAVLHLLLARDMHAENFVAHGPFPVVVDFECPLPPRFAFETSEAYDARRHLPTSLILPERLAASDGGWFDISALGGAEGTSGPTQLWCGDAGTDRMSAQWRVSPVPVTQNRPILAGHAAEPCEFEEPFVEGFRDTFSALSASRDFLSGASSPLMAFRSLPRRLVLRASAQYSRALRACHAPDAWSSRWDRERRLENLREDLLGTGLYPLLAPHEIEPLLTGNKPLFHSTCGGREVFDERGARVALPVLQTGYERVLAHLEENFDADGLRFQEELIARSFESRRAHVRQVEAVAEVV